MIWHQELDAGECWEITSDGALLGYVIRLSGGWDGYIKTFNGMKQVACNMTDKEAAILKVEREAHA